MPYKIIKKKDNKFQLYNITKKKLVNKKFNTTSSAQSASNNFMRYEKFLSQKNSK